MLIELSSSKEKNEFHPWLINPWRDSKSINEMMKNLTRLSLLLIGITVFSGCVNVFKLADLRTDKENSNSNPEKAQQLMEEMGIAHGISNWDSIQTYHVTFEDEFYGFIGKQAHPYKEQKFSLSLNYAPKTFNGQLEILSGKEKGNIWGLQSWETYHKDKDGNLSAKKNEDMKFWLPTYQYFIEFPSRIQEATSIDYLGEKIIDGVKTEGIIASWNTIEAQKDVDQYLIWIDSESKRIVKIEYTVRDMFRFISGATYFQDYKEYNGLLLPSKLPVESNLVKDGLLHTMRIMDFKADLVSVDSLMPLK
ncbi:MAG: hypothetical protein COA38_19015 [Fluviicola sp.]|nr:MAG: hypothetical protein COA38_19015 [Fluviicola sp.]